MKAEEESERNPAGIPQLAFLKKRLNILLTKVGGVGNQRGEGG